MEFVSESGRARIPQAHVIVVSGREQVPGLLSKHNMVSQEKQSWALQSCTTEGCTAKCRSTPCRSVPHGQID
eukprot:699151-Amphidinium_carterae.2